MDLHLSDTFEGLKIKYSRVFGGQAQTQGDEVNLQKCIESIKEQLLSGNYQLNANQNVLHNFLENNTENKLELELREKMKNLKAAREKAKREMIEELKLKRNQDGIQTNAKLSLRNDLVFSALFGSNFSL